MTSDSSNGGRKDADDAAGVLVRTFSNADEAELAAAHLKARGIPCWISADDCGGMLPAMDMVRGVKLFVDHAHEEEAKALLAAGSTAPLPDVSAEPAQPGRPAAARPLFGPFIFGIVFGVVGCLLYQWMSRSGSKTHEYDNDADGRVDEIIVIRDGISVECSTDRNQDGMLDSWTFYDDQGRPKLYREDNNFDGKADVTWHYTNGMVASSESDRDFNGIPDVTYLFKYGLTVQGDWHPNKTNHVTHRQLFQKGGLTEEWRDTDADGRFDRKVLYDAFETPVSTNAIAPP